jgi:hypothetical protein
MQKSLPPNAPAPFDREDRILGRVLSGALIAALLFLLVGAVSHAPGPLGASSQSLSRAGGAALGIATVARAKWRREVDPFSPAND